MGDDHSLAGWFLTTIERGNPDTELDRRRGDGHAWTTGNHAEVLVHGATYFKHLHETILSMTEGDWVHFTDWRGDPDERLAGPGSEVGQLLADAAARGVHIRGLVWRSHPDQTKFSEQENLHLARIVNEKGGEVLLDERVRRGGSHHQKLFLLRHPQDESKDVAFVGGIDICHGRNDDERHLGDEQVYSMDPRYGDRPAWHDAQMLVRGPAVGDLAWTFRERWEDPTPLDHRNPVRKLMKDRAHEPDRPGRLPPMPSDPPPAGTLAIQVLRTYPYK
ncbi:MAG: phospholipase, partial [Actinomycetota bacterium]|nr:phospholipase [Actinomycetota bacterium]